MNALLKPKNAIRTNPVAMPKTAVSTSFMRKKRAVNAAVQRNPNNARIYFLAKTSVKGDQKTLPAVCDMRWVDEMRPARTRVYPAAVIVVTRNVVLV